MKLWKDKDFVLVEAGSPEYDFWIKKGFKEDNKKATAEKLADPFRQEGDVLDLEAMNKIELEDFARQQFGYELDRRWSLKRMRERVVKLFDQSED